MKNVLLTMAGLALLTSLVFACKRAPSVAEARSVKVGTASLEKAEGPGCTLPEDQRTNCAEVKLAWPVIEEGSDALRQAVQGWVEATLSGMLAYASEADAQKVLPVEQAVQSFLETHRQFLKEAPDATSYFTAECSHKTLLNDGRYLTLQMEGYTYTGGPHGNPMAKVGTFDVVTGKQYALKDLVSDLNALKAIAEKAFRAERQDLFNPEDGSDPFEFDEVFPFALPQNFGLTANGLYCYYVPYEVGPYAIGSTQFTIPYSELGKLLNAPVPAAAK